MIGKVLLAAGIPLLAMTGIGVLLIAQGDSSNGRSTIAVGVIAAAVAGASFVYQVERWSLAKQSAIHLAIMLATVLPALLLSGWFDLGTAHGWWGAIGAFALWGIGLWTVFFLLFRFVEKCKARRHSAARR